jgi:hypothetical protein
MGIPAEFGPGPGGGGARIPPPKKKSPAVFIALGCLGAVVLAAALIAALILMTPADFSHYSAKAKQSEAKINLRELETAQTLHHLQAKEYASPGADRKCFDIIAWQPEGKTRYTYYCGDEKFPCTSPRCDPCPNVKNLSRIAKDSYTLMAVGNVDRDQDCDVWIINDAKNLQHVHDDVAP